MTRLQIAVLVFIALSAVITTSQVDKPRKVIDPTTATIALLINLVLALLVIFFGAE